MANIIDRINGLFQRISRPSLRFGLIFGLILTVVEIILGILSYFLQQASAQSVLSTLILAAFLGAGYLAGQRAAQETAKLSSGAAAGIWTGLIGSILEAVLPLILYLIYLPTYVAALQQDFTSTHGKDFPGMTYSEINGSYALQGFLLFLLSNILLYTIIALFGGLFGGFMGKRRAQTLYYAANSGADEQGAEEIEAPDEASEPADQAEPKKGAR
jgi:heme/copper-type cytochrome/quinol oxidase subunit 3